MVVSKHVKNMKINRKGIEGMFNPKMQSRVNGLGSMELLPMTNNECLQEWGPGVDNRMC